MNFKVGDHAVYPGQGVGQLVSIESKDICGNQQVFYTIHILETGMKVMIPKQKAQEIGLRHIISSSEAQAILDILLQPLSEKKTPSSPSWNRRYKAYMERVRSGSIFEIAEILFELKQVSMHKELGFGEKKVYTQAKQLLLSEINLISDCKDLQDKIAQAV